MAKSKQKSPAEEAAELVIPEIVTIHLHGKDWPIVISPRVLMVAEKATGLNFTDYVSRVRIEKAKNLLLNPHLRVSEIAYEVGFQSLTHFNRVFKKIIGQSPTNYRTQLKCG